MILMVSLTLLVASSNTTYAVDKEASVQLDLDVDLNLNDDTSPYTMYAIFNADYLNGYISDSIALIGAPLNWDKSDWGKAGLILTAALILYDNDAKIQNWFQDNRNGTTDSISKAVEPFGYLTVLLPLSGLYLYGYNTDDIRARRTALLGLESMVQSGLIIAGLKFAGHRSRPHTGDPYNTWGGPGLSTNDDRLSFASFHSSTAFAIATVVADEYSQYPVIPFISYSIATLTALSRINENEHWASDVFIGSAIGYFTAKTILARHPANGDSWTVLPKVDAENIGISVTYRFN